MPSDHPAIRVRNPGRKYTIGGPHDTLRDAIVNSVYRSLICFEETLHAMKSGFLREGDIHV